MLLPILLTALQHAPSSLTLIDLHKSEQTNDSCWWSCCSFHGQPRKPRCGRQWRLMWQCCLLCAPPGTSIRSDMWLIDDGGRGRNASSFDCSKATRLRARCLQQGWIVLQVLFLPSRHADAGCAVDVHRQSVLQAPCMLAVAVW